MQTPDSDTPLYLDTSRTPDERARDLVSRMTLAEKCSQMLWTAPAVERLGVPEYNWWNECLHGVGRAGRATVFPQAINLAATFDVELAEEVASVISDEARAKHHAAVRRDNRGQYRGLTFWTPNINIFRDPRWGRGQETYGEDPYLTGEIGVAFVRGLQGTDPRHMKVAACAKHYAVHSGPEGLRHEFDAVVDQRDLRETYLPAFERLVKSGVESVMGAYNRVNGEPCCAHSHLMDEILFKEWDFQGHYVSDCWAVRDFHTGHKVTNTFTESAALAVKHRCDLNCGCTYEHLLDAVKEGLLSEEDIDPCVTALMRTRIRLGMFDPEDEVPYASIPLEVVRSEKHLKLARALAARSFVLLKNDNVLPLRLEDPALKRIYVLGPTAADTSVLLANYYGSSDHLVTFLEGITAAVPEHITVEYRPGAPLDRASPNPVQWGIYEAANFDVTIACFGVTPNIEGEEGDAILSDHRGDRDEIGLPEHQVAFLRQIRERGKKIVLVLTGGCALATPELQELADAILFVGYPGEQGGHALADVLFGAEAPGGHLPVTFPMSKDDLPPFEDYAMEGRTYRFSERKPLYPFGFGLSYGKTVFADLKLPESVATGEEISVEVSVRNAGERPLREAVQVYLSWEGIDLRTPLQALVAFQSIALEAGATERVRLTIGSDALRVFDMQGVAQRPTGQVRLTVGAACPGPRAEELGAPKPVSGTVRVG